MTSEDKVRFLVFVGFVGAVYAAAGLVVLAWAVRKVRRSPSRPRSGAGKWTRRGVLGLAGGGSACMAWAYFVEPYRLEVTRAKIVSPKLRRAARPLRLVHISDLHCDLKVRNEDRLPGMIADHRPDLIAFTGDCVNTPAALGSFKRCLKRIAQIAPTFACKGNWETHFGIDDYFGGTGAIELNGSWRRIELAGVPLRLGGLAWADRCRIDEVLAAPPSDEFGIFLFHYPDMIYRAAAAGVDLYCAGHTHGGQVALPGYGALITLSRYGKRFESGLFRVRETHMYVNRGIGMEGGPSPRIRFASRPEITLIELSPEA